jgi:BMFP domain-containing protein YqiC
VRTSFVHQFCATFHLLMDAGPWLRYGSRMLDAKILDDIARRLSSALPEAARTVQADLEKNLRAAIQSVFAKLDLVNREEFDVQRKLLARSRAKIEQLEKQVAELEARLLNK